MIFWQQEGDGPLSSGTSPSSRTARSTARPAGAAPRRGSRSCTARGGSRRGDELRHRSIVDSEFRGRVVGEAEVAGRPAVVTEVEGSAFRTGRASFELDPDDPLGDGFLLR